MMLKVSIRLKKMPMTLLSLKLRMLQETKKMIRMREMIRKSRNTSLINPMKEALQVRAKTLTLSRLPGKSLLSSESCQLTL